MQYAWQAAAFLLRAAFFPRALGPQYMYASAVAGLTTLARSLTKFAVERVPTSPI